jgi:hypothetical protein
VIIPVAREIIVCVGTVLKCMWVITIVYDEVDIDLLVKYQINIEKINHFRDEAELCLNY